MSATTVQKETCRLAKEAAQQIEQVMDFPQLTSQLMPLVLGKLADIIVLNKSDD